MKTHHIITLSLALLITIPALAEAQSKKPRFTKKDLEKRFNELDKSSSEVRGASDKIPDRDQLRKAFDAVDKALNEKLGKQLDEEAKRVQEGTPSDSESARARAKELMNRAKEFAPEEIKRIEQSELARKMKSKSKAEPAPPEVPEEARKLANVTFTVAGGGSIKLPDLAKVSWDGQRTPIEGHGPAPGRPPYTFAEMEARRKKNIEEINITSTGGAIFAESPEEAKISSAGRDKGPIAIFRENVFVDHPEFKIDCDELTVFMRPGATEKDDEEGASKPAAKKNVADESIQEAIATGREVTVQRVLADKLEIGKAKRLIYDGDTGDVILIGQAQVQRGENLLEGEEILLPKDGAAQLTKGAKINILRIRK